MEKHLEQISQRTGSGRHAVIIADGASWHTQQITKRFSNFTLIISPPYSPELNPVEQVWQWLRQHYLANRCFNGYDNIVEQCSRAWNSFRKDTERVKILCQRDWIKLIS